MVLKALGDLYTSVGRVNEGLQIDLTLSKMCPTESEVWYNLGCSYALTGEKEQALHALVRSVDLGYKDLHWMCRDTDLASLRGDERFEALLLRLKNH